MSERRQPKALLFDPVSLQVFRRVEPSRHSLVAGRHRLLDIRGKVQDVPPSAVVPLEPEEAVAALQALWQDPEWQRELLRSVGQVEWTRLLTAESAEQFTQALIQVAKTNQLPELEKRFAALEAHTAQAAELLAKGRGPSGQMQAFAVPEQHPALLALLALCRSLPAGAALGSAEAPAEAAKVQVQVAPPRLDFSTQRIASVLGRSEKDKG